MPVSDFIAHQIDRATPDQSATVHYRDDSIALDDHASQLLNEIKQAFSTKTSKSRVIINNLKMNFINQFLHQEFILCQVHFSNLNIS